MQFPKRHRWSVMAADYMTAAVRYRLHDCMAAVGYRLHDCMAAVRYIQITWLHGCSRLQITGLLQSVTDYMTAWLQSVTIVIHGCRSYGAMGRRYIRLRVNSKFKMLASKLRNSVELRILEFPQDNLYLFSGFHLIYFHRISYLVYRTDFTVRFCLSAILLLAVMK